MSILTPRRTVFARHPVRGDGIVNSLDLWTLVLHYLESTTNGPTDGDFNCSGNINVLDFEVLVNNYG